MPDQFARLFTKSVSVDPTPPARSFQTMLQQALAIAEPDVSAVL